MLTGSVLLTFPVATSAQVTPLNNLVARVDQPRGPIPAECEQGLSLAAPLRVEVRDIELPVDEPGEPVAPPSGALRAALEQTQMALTSNDRPAFNAALTRTKALLSTYPTGAERRTAEDILRLHETAARLWDTQYEAPFFGETDPEYALVSGLPGFAEAVRRSTLTDDKDRRFYPTAESRDFVADLAGERLQRLGIHRTTNPVREDRIRENRNQRPRSTPPRASSSTGTTPPRAASSSTGTTPRRSASSNTPRQSSSASASSRRSSSSASPRRTPAATSSARASEPSSPRRDPAPAPRPAATTVAPRPSAHTPPPAVVATPTPAPVTTLAPTTESAATGTPTADVPITSDTDATATNATTADATTTAITSTAVVPTVPSTSPGRSVILPAILILIGLGVLIVLFRASK